MTTADPFEATLGSLGMVIIWYMWDERSAYVSMGLIRAEFRILMLEKKKLKNKNKKKKKEIKKKMNPPKKLRISLFFVIPLKSCFVRLYFNSRT